MSSRKKLGLSYIAWSLLFPALLGAVFALIPAGGTYIEGFIFMYQAFYFLCSAGCTTAGLLCFLTNINEDYVLGFGSGLYYGTCGTTLFLAWLLDSEQKELFLVGFVIAALVCYIVWLTKCKEK